MILREGVFIIFYLQWFGKKYIYFYASCDVGVSDLQGLAVQ